MVRIIAGCDKTAATCRTKFANFLNFRGFPHIPGEDWLTSYPVPDRPNARRVAGLPGAAHDAWRPRSWPRRGWIGHALSAPGQSVKGAGTDCLGLLRGRLAGGSWAQSPRRCHPIPTDWAEPSRRGSLAGGGAALAGAQGPDQTARPAMCCCSGCGRAASPSILGIQSDTGAMPRFIHAYTGHGVIESPLSQPWQRRIAARFAFPEGAN